MGPSSESVKAAEKSAATFGGEAEGRAPGGLRHHRLEIHKPRPEQRPRQLLQRPIHPPVQLDLVIQRPKHPRDRPLLVRLRHSDPKCVSGQ